MKTSNNTKSTVGKVLIGTLVVLLLSVSTYGSLAYFSASETARNVITAGNVKIMVMEDSDGGIPFPEDGISAMPGDVITKRAYVRNVGKNTVWIRIQLNKLTDKGLSFDEYMSLDINTYDWLYSDGWYYYTKPVDAKNETLPLFTKVSVDSAMDNRYQSTGIQLTVNAQAVQYANNASDVLSAAGWPE